MSLHFNKLHMQNKAVQLFVALGLAAVLVVAGYFAAFQSQWEEYQVAQQKEEDLKNEFSDKSIKAASLDNLKEELRLIEESIKILLKQLPTSSEVPTLLQELHQAAAKNNLTMSTFVAKPAVTEGVVERLPFSMSLSGSHEQIAKFARDVGRMSRIVTLANIDLHSNTDKNSSNNSSANKDKGSGTLTLSALANTYKALDVAEASGVASGASAPRAATK